MRVAGKQILLTACQMAAAAEIQGQEGGEGCRQGRQPIIRNHAAAMEAQGLQRVESRQSLDTGIPDLQLKLSAFVPSDAEWGCLPESVLEHAGSMQQAERMLLTCACKEGSNTRSCTACLQVAPA